MADIDIDIVTFLWIITHKSDKLYWISLDSILWSYFSTFGLPMIQRLWKSTKVWSVVEYSALGVVHILRNQGRGEGGSAKWLCLIMGERGGVTGEMIMDNGVNNVNFMGKLKNIFKDL